MSLHKAMFEEATELTDAERAVVHDLLRGLPYEKIAALRDASPRTVANQVAAAYRKSGARSRAELAAQHYPVPSELACEECIAYVLPSLSAPERRVVYFAALGHTNKWIAFELGVTASSIAGHLGRAVRKLGLRCRVELARVLCERASTARECACGGPQRGANDAEQQPSPK